MTQLRKHISTFSLMMTGVTAIIGSGWLLGTQKVANVAGPAGVISWFVGAAVALLVGLLFVEIGSAYPSSGGIGYYTHITHGRFCGFLTSWINWLSIVAVAPIEAQSIVQYLSQISPRWYGFYDLPTHALTTSGIYFAIALVIFFTLINFWSVRLFIRFNNIFTIIKIVVPLLTIAALLYNGFHPQNFVSTHEGGFMPYGLRSIFIGVVTCGVVMAFNGFQSPLTFSEEIESPKTMLPIAVGGSILFALVLYVMLQVVFTGSLSAHDLAHGWNQVNLRSPYIELLLAANLQLMVTVVYAGAAISPGVCGAAFVASSARIMYTLSREGHLPKFLSKIHPIFHNPRNAILACMGIGCVFLFMFRGWYHLVAVISIIHLFSYLPAPVVVVANRIKNRRTMLRKDQFRLPLAHVFSPIILFVLSTLLFYAGWPLIPEMLILIVPGLFLYFYYERKNASFRRFLRALNGASWLLLYFIGLCVIVYLGNNPLYPGTPLSTIASVSCLAVLTLATYCYGAFFAWEREKYVPHHQRKSEDNSVQ